MSAVVDSLKKVSSTVTQPKKLTALLGNNEVMQVVLLFALLSPGLLLQVPASGQNAFDVQWMNMKTSQVSVLMHALVLFVVLHNSGVARKNIYCAVLLFVALSPGFLLELPSSDDHVVTTNRTSYEAIAVHSLLFMVIYGSLC